MLFRRFQIPRESIECALGRRLSGDPSRGELGVLAVLNKGRLGDAREKLQGDVGADFRAFVCDHLRAAETDWGHSRLLGVHLRPEAFSAYMDEARSTGESLDRVLSAAIERDFLRRGRTP